MRRAAAISAVFSTAFASTFGSSVVVGAEDAITARFHAPKSHGTLLVSMYLIGSSAGPFIYAPLSEMLGRRYPLIIGVTIMTIFTAASAVAPNWGVLLAFRCFAGFGSSGPMVIGAGILADVFLDPVLRGYAVCCLMAVTTLGFLAASSVSLRVMDQSINPWNLCLWINTAVAGISWLAVCAMPETRTTTMNAHTLPRSPSIQLTKILLPARMVLFEPIVLSTCVFLSLEYSILYLFFQLLPAVFAEARGVSTSNAGFLFAPFAVGTVLACCGYVMLDPKIREAAAREDRRHAYPEYRRLPVACFGSFLIVLSLFLLGYSTERKVKLVLAISAEGAFVEKLTT